MGKTVVNLLSEAQGLQRISQAPQTFQKIQTQTLGKSEIYQSQGERQNTEQKWRKWYFPDQRLL